MSVGFVPYEGLSFVLAFTPLKSDVPDLSDDMTRVRALRFGHYAVAVATWDPEDPR